MEVNGSKGRKTINKYLKKTGREDERGRIFIAPFCLHTILCLGSKRYNEMIGGQVWFKIRTDVEEAYPNTR